MVNYNKLARFLGWFSLGLGLFEVLQPKRVQQLVDVRGDYSGVVRALGVREIVHALLIFLQGRPSQGVWSRVAGDMVDLAVLGAAVTSARTGQSNITSRIAERGEMLADSLADRTGDISDAAARAANRAASRAGRFTSRMAERAADRTGDLVSSIGDGHNGRAAARTAARVASSAAERAGRVTSRAADQAETFAGTLAERAWDIGEGVSRFIAERFNRRPSRRKMAIKAARKAARSAAIGAQGAALTARDAARTANRFMDDVSTRAGKVANENRTALIVASLLGIAAIDLLTATQLTRQRRRGDGYNDFAGDFAGNFAAPYLVRTDSNLSGRTKDGAFKVSRSITINRPPDELYRFWRDFHNLPQFMYHLEDVQVLDERRSHWVTKAPAGTRVEWDAEITEDQPNELIAWQSLPGADVPNRGQVRFMSLLNRPGSNNATEVRVEIEYNPPAGALGKAVAKLFGEDATQQVHGDLRRFKQVMEIGEVVRSEGSPQGFGQKAQRPARPE